MQTASNHKLLPANSDDEIDLTRVFNALRLNKMWIALSLAAGAVVGIAYTQLATPVYQANALLQIESEDKSQILKDLSALTGSQRGAAATEIQIMRSRMVLGAAVDTLVLTAQPVYRKSALELLSSRAEEIPPAMTVSIMAVPHKQLNRTFAFTIEGTDRFTVSTPDGQSLAGRVGTILTTADGATIHIGKLQGSKGDVFDVTPISRQSAIEQLSRTLQAQENGKETSILGLKLNDDNPAQAQSILNAIIDFYVQQDKDYDAQVAASSLSFITQQLPVIKANLEHAENALNTFRNRNATVDVAAESQGVVETLNQIEMQLTDLKIKESEVTQLYTPEHPVYKAISEKKAVLDKARKQLLARISGLPRTQQEIIRLKRDVEIQQQIYLQLLQKQQELNITQASRLGKIRVIDRALAMEEPVKPQKAQLVLASTLGSGILAAMFFVLKGLLRRGVEEAAELEGIGVPVLATIPHSTIQGKHDKIQYHLRKRNSATTTRSTFLLAASQPDDTAAEALRSLRIALFVRLMEAKNNVVMITGATTQVGKTFVSANLGAVMAQSGKKVLLIDADMRKGYVHELLAVSNAPGLSDVLSGGTTEPVVQKTNVAGLDVLTHGSAQSSPAELLHTPRFSALLQELSSRYDCIIVDVPPALAVTDANVVGQLAGTTLLVTYFEKTTLKEVDMVMHRLQNSQVAVHGAVINGVTRSASNYHAYDAYTRYA